MFQESVAEKLNVTNMREGFWNFTERNGQNVTVAGFGYLKNSQSLTKDKGFQVKVMNTISFSYQFTKLSQQRKYVYFLPGRR